MKVYQAITKVQAALAKEGISKSRKNEQQGYKFRGIDDVYNALAPVLAEHGLCILPRILSRSVVERETARGGALFYVTVEAEFDFVCAEDGSKHTIRTYGEAMDSGDKATNKAMSAAYKYAAMQAFAIPTEGDNDADNTTHEVKANKEKVPKPNVSGKGQTTHDMEHMDDATRAKLKGIALDVVEHINDGNLAVAYQCLVEQDLDATERSALWSLFDSKQRSALKAEGQRAREAVTA